MNKADEKTMQSHIVSYIIGFVLSLILTVVPYYLVVNQVFQGKSLVAALVVFASAQLFVQMRYFLHVGKGSNKQWNLIAFSLMAIVVGIVVLGSLWIMNDLNYRMMSPHDMNEYMMKEVDKGF